MQKWSIYFSFLKRNLLLKFPISDEKGKVIKRFIIKDDLTEEGKTIASGPKNPVHKWLASKASQKIPPNMSALEKALAEIRKNPA